MTGDHIAPTTIKRFHSLSKYVGLSNYYILQDTRLDFDCAYAQLTQNGPWDYCHEILDKGGSWMAADELKDSEGFTQDREVEFWRITQHPGGYLKRVKPANLTWRGGGTTWPPLHYALN